MRALQRETKLKGLTDRFKITAMFRARAVALVRAIVIEVAPPKALVKAPYARLLQFIVPLHLPGQSLPAFPATFRNLLQYKTHVNPSRNILDNVLRISVKPRRAIL